MVAVHLRKWKLFGNHFTLSEVLMQGTAQDDAKDMQALATISALQAHITSQLAPTRSLTHLPYVAADQLEDATGCGSAAITVGMELERVVESADSYRVVFTGNIKVDPTSRVEMTLQRTFSDFKTGTSKDHYTPCKIDVLADEWPGFRALLLEMIAQCDRLEALYPVLLPAITPAPAPVAAATAAEPSAPARRGRANPNRRGASSRSRGG